MIETGYEPEKTGWGPILVGLLSIAGGVSLVCANALLVFDYQQFAGSGFVELVVEYPLSYVVYPALVVVGWLLVGGVLVVGGARALPLGAAAFLGATVVDLIVVVTEVLGVRPIFLWYADPVTPIVELPFRLLATVVGPVLGYPLLFYLLGGVGTVTSLLLGVYLAGKAVRTDVLSV